MVMKNNEQNLKKFKTLWIRFNKQSTGKHQLFLKEHSIRNQAPEHPRGRTLFLLNIPPYVTTSALKTAFNKLCGNVEKVLFSSPVGFKTAHIVFTNELGLQKALNLQHTCTLICSSEENMSPIGLTKWCMEYNNSVIDEETMKKEIEEYLNNYDQTIIDRIEREKAAEADAAKDDGWVTVTGKKKRGQYALSRKESTISKVQNKEDQKNRKKQLLNFYTFQIRESKKQNLAELRKKFELDKKRLQELKSKRTFKPF